MKLDIGCGKKKQDGHIGIDRISFPGVDHVLDAGNDRWPFDDGSIDEVYASHFVEHLTPKERIHFANEAHRVLKKGGKALIIVPHWASARAYGDLTHQWPPVSEFWFPYLNAAWRAENAPHNTDYSCDFDTPPGGYDLRPDLALRNGEYQQYALQNFKESAMNFAQTIFKR